MSGGNFKEMFFAIEKGDLELVRYHLQLGMDPNYEHPEVMSTTLVEAMQKNQPAIARLLLQHGANPDLIASMEGVNAHQAAVGNPALESVLDQWKSGHFLRNDLIKVEELVDGLAQNAVVFEGLFQLTSQDQPLWRPRPDKWSLLEVVCHLVDEEKEDFRARVRHCLENPDQQPPPIDPQSWVKERDYQSRNFEEQVALFLHERQVSIDWLKSLDKPEWELGYKHVEAGFMSAEMFLANWLAHDYLHFRQVQGLRFGYLSQKSKHPLFYAGNW